MKRRCSRRALVIEVSASDDGTLSANWTEAMPRPPLPYAQRPLLCALGRHRAVVTLDRVDDKALWPTHAVVRCARCGVLRR